MSERITGLLDHLLAAAHTALWALGSVAVIVFALALILKGRSVFDDIRAALPESRTNILLYLFDLLIVTPLLIIPGLVLIERMINGAGIQLIPTEEWEALPLAATGFAVLFLGDFVGYFRHRIEHWHLLWPYHAVHHSDTQVTWLTSVRLHPLHRLGKAYFDTAILAMLGFPAWAIVFLTLVTHFYRAMIHMNVDWTFGPLGRVFVSPAMHRWHHVLEGRGQHSNFALMFSIHDQIWNTWYMPGACNAPLGVAEDMGRGVGGQLMHPFKVWLRSLGLLSEPKAERSGRAMTPGE